MTGLRGEVPMIAFDGVGGPLMQEQGLRSLFAMDELSLMGIAEILPKYRHLKRRIRQTADAVIAAKPDVLITIDSPDFCLRVARLVKVDANIRTVHYVAPTVWAWRAGRAEKMAQHIDHVLALFPFEPPLIQAAGMTCDFVGHPVAAEPPVDPTEMDAFGIDGPVLVVLPGSRKSEIERLSQTFIAAVRVAGLPHKVVIPTLPHLASRVADLFAPLSPVIVGADQDNPALAARTRLAAMARADVALAASGTVSLELASARTPMVVAYD
ncbi:lipid-A-disaccharide synthase, partial [Octadecabacter sp.]|nr:lipid-A-disaccharide synthase [Octadecabacter sp.]